MHREGLLHFACVLVRVASTILLRSACASTTVPAAPYRSSDSMCRKKEVLRRVWFASRLQDVVLQPDGLPRCAASLRPHHMGSLPHAYIEVFCTQRTACLKHMMFVSRWVHWRRRSWRCIDNGQPRPWRGRKLWRSRAPPTRRQTLPYPRSQLARRSCDAWQPAPLRVPM